RSYKNSKAASAWFCVDALTCSFVPSQVKNAEMSAAPKKSDALCGASRYPGGSTSRRRLPFADCNAAQGGDRSAARGGKGNDHSAPGHQRDVVAHAVADAGRPRDAARSAADGGSDRVHPRGEVERRVPLSWPELQFVPKATV